MRAWAVNPLEMGETDPGSESQLRVGGGWIRPPVFGLVILLILIAIGSGVARWATTHSSVMLGGLLWALGLAMGSIIAVVLASTYFSFVREVRLSRDEVGFKTGRRWVRVRWGDLVPPTSPYFLGINFRYRVRDVVQERDPQFVTKAQARAILEHPSHPNWIIPEPVWRSLGMAPRKE